MSPFEKARRLIDAAHEADPARTPDGRAAELDYADKMEAWVERLVPDAPEILRLAARCQHLERWSVPRASYPADRVGYLTWRKFLYGKQAARAKELLLEAGVSEAEADEVETWVSKSGLKTNAGTQALEDAAILVFLENEILSFVAQHADYPREKFMNILRKSWAKLSSAGQQAALGLELPAEVAGMIREALGG
jgi:tRNAThr (cytosine32-N3)-methyltransferase